MESYELSGFNVLIVDGPGLHATLLRQHFIEHGAKVYVAMSEATALRAVESNNVDIVMVGFNSSNNLKSVLQRRGIPHIACATPTDVPTLPRFFGRTEDAFELSGR
jgi:CheY-like chemotaxis protein